MLIKEAALGGENMDPCDAIEVGFEIQDDRRWEFSQLSIGCLGVVSDADLATKLIDMFIKQALRVTIDAEKHMESVNTQSLLERSRKPTSSRAC